MIRPFAKWRAKRQYVWKLELEAATQDINAQLATNRAKEKRAFIEQLNREADDIEANIAIEEQKLEQGYWLCEKGHESKTFPTVRPAKDHPANLCVVKVNGSECGKEVKLIKLDQMTGQEKYEADKEKDDAKKIAAQKRKQAEDEATNVSEGEKTAQFFRSNAQNSRIVADKIKHL